MRYRVLSYTGVVYDAIATIDETTFAKYKNAVMKIHGNKYTKSLITTNYALYETIRRDYKNSKI